MARFDCEGSYSGICPNVSRIRLAANDLSYSRHAHQRLRQRGKSCQDIELICRYGELVEDGYVMTEQALQMARCELKQQGDNGVLQRLDHLHQMAVIVQDGVVVTAYHIDARRLRRLRHGHVQAA